MDKDAANESENVASLYSNFEGDFEQTISLLDMDVDEVEIKVQQSFEVVWSENLYYYYYHMLSISLTLTSSLGQGQKAISLQLV